VIVELPVVVTVPSHISISSPSKVLVDFCHVAPPPLTEAMVIDDELIDAIRTRASPTFWGFTDKVVLPGVPEPCCNVPTAEIVPAAVLAVDVVVRSPSPL
jgi:hypothetical protein